MNPNDCPLLAPPVSATLPERRAGDVPGSALLMRMLEEIDYGLLLVNVLGELRYANQLALQETGAGGLLQMGGTCLQTRSPAELARMQAALADAAMGRRSLVKLGLGANVLLVAVIPIDAGPRSADPGRLALLVFNKRAACAALTIDFYARSNRLTATETAVLLRLSEGRKPKDIARMHGVALCTVRSQIVSIRHKTQTASIGELTARLAALPPFTPAVKSIRGRSESVKMSPAFVAEALAQDAASLFACAAC